MRQQLVCASLASRIIYREGLDYFRDTPDRHLADLVLAYLLRDQRNHDLVHEVETSKLPDAREIRKVFRECGRLAEDLGADLQFESTLDREASLQDTDFMVNTATITHNEYYMRDVRNLVRRYDKGKPPSANGVLTRALEKGVELRDAGKDELRPWLDDVFHAEEREIRKFNRLIGTIVSAAPLLGLLGTVIGMIETFDSLGDMSLFSQSGGIAGGISQALITTQMGLAVAIPGLIVNGVLTRRQKNIELELAQLKDILCSEPPGRKGA